MRSMGISRPRSRSWKPLSRDRKRFTRATLPRWLARGSPRRSPPRDPSRALNVAETTLGVAKASGHRALEAELLHVKASALLSLDAAAAEAAANEGYELAWQLGLGPEQGHGLRILGDIMAAEGDATRADELHGLARAKFRSLGMKRWAEESG
jgi:hypothetical protein